MCLACAAVAAPEVAVIVGGYAAVRVGRPVARLRDALGRGPATEPPAGPTDAQQSADDSAHDSASVTRARDRVPVTPVP